MKKNKEHTEQKYTADVLAKYNYDGYTQYVFPSGCDLFYNNNLVYSVNNASAKFLYETYYTLDSRYNVITTPSNKGVTYIPEKYVEYEKKLINTINKFTNVTDTTSGLESIKNNISKKYYLSRTHAIIISQNNKLFLDSSDERVMIYNSMEKIYPKLVFIMPYFYAKNILQDSLSQIYNFIATRHIDISRIEENSKSIKTCKFCYGTITILEKFIANPQKADLHEITDKISQSIQNIEKILELNGYKDFENTK